LTVVIGNCVLGERPRVALVVRDDISRKDVEPFFTEGVDLLEMRIDQFCSCESEYVCSHLKTFAGLPCIGTIRSNQEGGNWSGSETLRLALYKKIMPFVNAVDIEINAEEINNAVIEEAKRVGAVVIGSFHDFKSTPSADCLEGVLEKGKLSGVDIIKIAAQCNVSDDLRILTHFLVTHDMDNLILLGMGHAGAPSRLFFPFLGSLVTYTFLGTPSAPGQFNCLDTISLIKKISGPFAMRHSPHKQ